MAMIDWTSEQTAAFQAGEEAYWDHYGLFEARVTFDGSTELAEFVERGWCHAADCDYLYDEASE